MNKPADEIFQLVLEIHRSVRQRFTTTGKNPSQTNPLQLFALFAIHDQRGITMGELAKTLKTTSPSATSLANRLVKYGWIERGQDKTNRKIVRLKLTSKGKKILENHWREKNSMMNSLIGLLPVHDQKEFARILRSLLDHISQS